MVRNVVVLVALVAFAVALTGVHGDATSAACSANNVCTRTADCDGTDFCCGNRCVSFDDIADKGKILGDTCSSSYFCEGACVEGTCSNSQCERATLPIACSGCDPAGVTGPTCDSNAFCDYNATRPASANVCRSNYLPPGSACVLIGSTSECARGACQADGTCPGIAVDTACNPYVPSPSSPPPPSIALQCSEPNVCVTQDGLSSKTCTGQRRPTGGYCLVNSDCDSGSCDGTVQRCIPAFSYVAGTNCTSNYNCESHLCQYDSNLAGTVCGVARYSRDVDEACPQGDINCRPGLKCVGSKTSDAAPVCKNVVGDECDSDSDCGVGKCQCTGVDKRCLALVVEPTACDAAKALVEKLGDGQEIVGNVFGDTPFLQYTSTAAAAYAQALADYYCCLGTEGNGGANKAASLQSSPHKLECSPSGNSWVVREPNVPDFADYKMCTPTQRYAVNEIISGVRPTADPTVVTPSSALASSPLSLSSHLIAALAIILLAALAA